jgi:ABC-type sugar transport system ATPase subunit
MSAPVLEVQALRKAFGAVEALRDANLVCPAGEVTALVGDNGAGKSTLIRCITGVHPATAGTIRFKGEEVAFASPMAARRRGIETVFQDLALVEDLTVWQNMYLNREIAFGFGPFRWLDRRRMIRETEEKLGRLLVNMPPVRAKVRRMSGGQRQTISIGRAASWGSALVIMDEPTAALGLRERGAVEELIGNLRKEGLAQLVISHDLEQVMRISDSIWVMRGGRTIVSYRTKEVDRAKIAHTIAGGDA